eukprot:769231-Prymnesium_polylepis.1
MHTCSRHTSSTTCVAGRCGLAIIATLRGRKPCTYGLSPHRAGDRPNIGANARGERLDRDREV